MPNHLEFSVSHLGDSLDHVSDVGADSSDSSQLLVDTEPLLHDELIAADLPHVDSKMAEGADEGATGSLHRHTAGAHLEGDCNAQQASL